MTLKVMSPKETAGCIQAKQRFWEMNFTLQDGFEFVLFLANFAVVHFLLKRISEDDRNASLFRHRLCDGSSGPGIGRAHS